MSLQFNKKGLSGVVATVLLVLLVIVAAGIIWGVVNNLLSSQLKGAQSCFDLFDKVKVNDRYTCLNNTNNLTHLSLEIKDVEVDSVSISISDFEGSKTFEISSEGNSYPFARYLSGSSFGEQILLPGKNAAKTYVIDNSLFGISNPNSISVAPKVNGEQCDVSDSLNYLEDCRNIV